MDHNEDRSISTPYLHNIYTISTQYLHIIYTLSTHCLHNIYKVCPGRRESEDVQTHLRLLPGGVATGLGDQGGDRPHGGADLNIYAISLNIYSISTKYLHRWGCCSPTASRMSTRTLPAAPCNMLTTHKNIYKHNKNICRYPHLSLCSHSCQANLRHAVSPGHVVALQVSAGRNK